MQIFRTCVAAPLRRLALIAVLAGPAVAQTPVAAPLPIDVAMHVRSFTYLSRISLSADGEWLAYSVVDPSERTTHDAAHLDFLPTGTPVLSDGSHQWLVNVRTGRRIDITGPRGASWGGTWSPDGKTLAFYSDRDGLERIWLWDRRSETVRRVSSLIAKPMYAYETVQWTPDGRGIVAKVLPPGDSVVGTPDSLARQIVDQGTGRASSVTVLSTQPGADSTTSTVLLPGRYMSDLVVISVADGSARHVVTRTPISSFSVSPNGRFIAFNTAYAMITAPVVTTLYRITVVDLTDGRARVAADSVLDFWTPPVSWSPDGESFAYTTTPEERPAADPDLNRRAIGECYVVNVARGTLRRVSNGLHADLSSQYRPPVWDASGTHLYVVGSDSLWRIDVKGASIRSVATVPGRAVINLMTPQSGRTFWSPADSAHAYIRTLDRSTMKVGVAVLDLATGGARQLFEEDAGIPFDRYGFFGVDAAGQTVAYMRQDAAHPEDVWVAGPTFADRRRLTHATPELDRYQLGTSRLVHWIDDDGDSLRGALLLPSNYDPAKRYPTVVWPYGGVLQSVDVNRFAIVTATSYDMQLLATRGYTIFVPDDPQHVGTPMLDLAKTILPGVNKLVEMGIADPNRLAIFGHSYGCYSTLSLLVQTTRFRAAICVSGPSDILDMLSVPGRYGQIWAENGQGLMKATPWGRRDRYIENSPYFYLDRVTTPVLLIQGTADTGARSFVSDKTYSALERLGKEVTYARYTGEQHTPMDFSPNNVRDFLTRTIGWLDEHLTPRDSTRRD